MSIWSMVRDVPTVATTPEALGGDAAAFLAPDLAAGALVAVGVVAASAATVHAAQRTAAATSTRGRFDQGWTAWFDRYGRGVLVWIIPWNGPPGGYSSLTSSLK